ncbi:MAG: metallophosphoesterase family protein [bacterium]
MNYLILSDIHSNLEALQSVLLEVIYKKIDKYIILGDLVGYGASPNEVIDIIRKKSPKIIIRGNHDKFAAGLESGADFNYIAHEAALWTQSVISPENKEFIANLSKGPIEVDNMFDIVHGSPWDENYYIFESHEALSAFNKSDKSIIFYGHTHIPIIWSFDENKKELEIIYIKTDQSGKFSFSLLNDKRYLINPGSVGQPRDYNNKSSFAIFDSDNMMIDFFRLNYDISEAQRKILFAGLNKFLAERLSIGT